MAKPEREKGAAPPDYMPAIFGWISMEDQQEQAREIADFTRNNNNRRVNNVPNHSDFNYSNLNDEELAKIKKLENSLNEDRGSNNLYIIAIDKQN